MQSDEEPSGAGPPLTYELRPDESFTEGVVSAVSEATGGHPAAPSVSGDDGTEELLPPLYRTIDTDALEALMSPGHGPNPDGDRKVSFEYNGFLVTVRSYGVVRVEPLGSGADSTR